MSATQRSMSALALLLGLVIASAAQVSSPQPPDRGIMPYPNFWWSLTVINLTTHDLAIVASSLDPSTCESKPFHDVHGNTLDGDPAFPLPPYRTVTWKGNDHQDIFCQSPHVSGYIDFLPVGMDPKWTVRLNFLGQGSTGWLFQQVYLTADLSNPGWNDVAPFSCSYPVNYNSKYNVMTLSGTDLLVTLYTPIIYQVKPSPSAMITLVVRERWPHTQLPSGYDESLVMPCLTFTNVSNY
jgi:hypothetical protein